MNFLPETQVVSEYLYDPYVCQLIDDQLIEMYRKEHRKHLANVLIELIKYVMGPRHFVGMLTRMTEYIDRDGHDTPHNNRLTWSDIGPHDVVRSSNDFFVYTTIFINFSNVYRRIPNTGRMKYLGKYENLADMDKYPALDHCEIVGVCPYYVQ